MVEIIQKPLDETFGSYFKRHYILTNPCFKRKVDDFSHLFRNLHTFFLMFLSLMFYFVFAYGVTALNPNASGGQDNITVLWNDPVAGGLALLMIFLIPLISFIVGLILELVIENAEKEDMNKIVRILLISLFFLTWITTIAVCIALWIVGGNGVASTAFPLWGIAMAFSIFVFEPIILTCIYFGRRHCGREREGDDPEVNTFPPSYC